MASPATEAAPGWLRERRARGAELAAELDLPTTRTKGWEFTDLAGLDLDAFEAADDGDPAALARTGGVFLPPPDGALTLDQVDGLVVAESDADLPDQPDRPLVAPLDAAAARWPELVERHLGTVVASDDPFVARNDSAWRGGALVYVPRGQSIDAPVLLTTLQEAAATALSRRTLIVLEEGAEAEVWEQHASADPAAETLLNTVCELVVGPSARLRYIWGQELGERSWLFGTQRAVVERDATLDWISLAFGSGRGKLRMETKLAGNGSSARVTGAYATQGRQHIDVDTLQEHAAEHTMSDLAFRGVLSGRSTAVWRGMIRVDPGAQQTDAFQESRNLLLSKRAHADAIPGLEIEANDVRCTHAAAIAQIDPEQLFYLRSRGLPQETGMRLVIDGFLQALVERFAAGAVHDGVSAALERRLEHVLGT